MILAIGVQVLVLGLILAIILAVVRRRPAAHAGREVVEPKDLFLLVLTTVALYASTIGMVEVIHGLADRWFPGPPGSDQGTGLLRVGVSIVIVVFPIFLYLNGLVRRKIRSGEIDGAGRIRGIFAYFGLFVIVVTVLIVLIVMVNVFLNGDLTPRFLIKSGGLLILVGLAFRYYRLDLEVEPENPPPVAPADSEVSG
ncbi:MAG: DUF5671 domain-containing protein [Actinomycetota bacterium]